MTLPVTSFGGPPVFKSYSSFSARKTDPKAPPELALYSADWCPHCRNAKAFFGANSIAYREVNIDNDTSGAAEFKRVFGGGGIPLAAAEDKTIRGFSTESMLYFLKANCFVDKGTYIEKGGKRRYLCCRIYAIWRGFRRDFYLKAAPAPEMGARLNPNPGADDVGDETAAAVLRVAVISPSRIIFSGAEIRARQLVPALR